jgi:hypothetical protein
MNDKNKLLEARKQLMAAWLLKEEDEASGSGFFKDVISAAGDIGKTIKKGAKDIASSIFGMYSVIFHILILDIEGAKQAVENTKNRSQKIESEYSATRNKINETLSSPGGMFFAAGVLPPSVAASGFLIGFFHNGLSGGEKTQKAEQFVSQQYKRFDKWLDNKKREEDRRNAENYRQQMLQSRQRNAPTTESINITNNRFLIFEKKQKENQEQMIKEFLIKSFKILNLRIDLILNSTNLIHKAIETHDLKNKEAQEQLKKENEKDKKEILPKINEVEEQYENFLEESIAASNEFISSLLQEQDYKFLESELKQIKFDQNLQSWKKGLQILQKIANRIPN